MADNFYPKLYEQIINNKITFEDIIKSYYNSIKNHNLFLIDIDKWISSIANYDEEQIKNTVESLDKKILEIETDKEIFIIEYFIDKHNYSFEQFKPYFWVKYMFKFGFTCSIFRELKIKNISEFTEEIFNKFIYEYDTHFDRVQFIFVNMIDYMIYICDIYCEIFNTNNISFSNILYKLENESGETYKEWDLETSYRTLTNFLENKQKTINFNKKLLKFKYEQKIKELEDTILTLRLRPPELGGDLYNEAKTEFSTTFDKTT